MMNYFYQKRDRHEPPFFQPEPEPPRNRRGLARMGIMLAVIGLLTVLLLLLPWPEWERPKPPRPEPPKPLVIPEEITTIPRAPVGDGTVLELMPLPEGGPHTYRKIYRENIASVVSVQGVYAEGVSQGTGIILSADGYVVTNAHVIEGCSSVRVSLVDGHGWDALLVGMDRETDLAVLKAEAENLRPAVFGDSSLVEVGDEALALGNPLGHDFQGTITDGIISAIDRDIQVDGYHMELIQTTAALNPGNSGGALINLYGQVIGITNLKMQSYGETVEGLGFAIPSVTVKRVADELIACGHISGRPAIGITVAQRTREQAQSEGSIQGLQVEQVRTRSDAWAKGIREGDWVVAANGRRVRTIDDLMAAKQGLDVGEVLPMTVFSPEDCEYRDVDVVLTDQYLLEEPQ